MDKEILIRLIRLVVEKDYLEKNDSDKVKMLENNPYALREGFMTDNMERVAEIEREIDSIKLK